jgi:hypothetical protein
MLLFAPAWMLYRKRGAPAVRVLLVFVCAYLVYWLNTLAVIRYALPALVLLFALTGARACDWLLESEGVQRASLTVAMIFSFVFSTLGCIAIGANLAELAWVRGGFDDRKYLEAALDTFRTSQYLRGAASAGQRVLGMEYYANLYSSEKLLVRGYPARRSGIPEAFLSDARTGDFQWLVVPVARAEEMRKETGGKMTERHRDSFFVVFQRSR